MGWSSGRGPSCPTYPAKQFASSPGRRPQNILKDKRHKDLLGTNPPRRLPVESRLVNISEGRLLLYRSAVCATHGRIHARTNIVLAQDFVVTTFPMRLLVFSYKIGTGSPHTRLKIRQPIRLPQIIHDSRQDFMEKRRVAFFPPPSPRPMPLFLLISWTRTYLIRVVETNSPLVIGVLAPNHSEA